MEAVGLHFWAAGTKARKPHKGLWLEHVKRESKDTNKLIKDTPRPLA